MAVDRTTIIQEPGLLVMSSGHFYSQGDIVVDFVEETQEIDTDVYGPVDERPVDRRIEVSFTPVGELENLSVLFPHGGLGLGASPFGNSDTACDIYTASGKRLTIHNAAVTQMPALALGHRETLFGEVRITGLLKNSADPTDANSYYTWAASGATYPGDAQFAASAIKTLGYKATWGDAPWANFLTEDGFRVAFSTNFEPVPVDGHGTVDMRLASMSVEVTATPVGIALADVLAALKYQGSGNALGASKASAADLVIVNQIGSLELHFELSKPTLKQTSAVFGAATRGVGELVWRATRTITAGSADPLFYVGTTAPS